MKVEKLILILAGLLILPCLLLAQEQASNPYKPKLAPHLIPGYTHYMIAISERGKDIVNLQSRSQFPRFYRHPDRPNAEEAMSSFLMELRITATSNPRSSTVPDLRDSPQFLK